MRMSYRETFSVVLMFGLGLALSSCGGVKADSSATAELVMPPVAGYTCFVIKNGSGEAVGGNCIRD